MKIDKNIDISIIERLTPLPYEVSYITPATKTFLFTLFRDEYFLKKIKFIRNKYSIPRNGMTIEDLFNTTESENASIPNVDKRKMAKLYYFMYNQPRNRVERNIYQKLLHSFTKEERKYISNNSLGDDKETKSKISIFEQMITMRKDIEPILKHYNLPMDYNMRFCLLIIYNTFKNFNDYDSIYILDKEYDLENGIRHEIEKGKVLVFVCNQNISKNKLKKWIDENWNSKIKERMNKLPLQPTKFSKNLEIFEEIDLLRKNGEKFSDISSRLTDNFPENSIFMDTETIRKYYERYLQLLKRYKTS